MEAMALKRPVISTFIAGIPDLVDREVGWIIPAGSKSAIQEAMRAALQSTPKQLAQMGETGRKRVQVLHDVHVNAAQLHRLISRDAC